MQKFRPTWESLKTHRVPDWYMGAKLGIFIHWGLYSVPAFAPPVGELGTIPDEEWYPCNPYAEWYFNSINIGRGPSYEHHIKTYGKDFPYENFADMWKAEKWDSDAWAQLFRDAGARYVVLVTKHHDGFCLFPSDYTDYSAAKRGPMRDIVGELTDSVRAQDMKMGLYYSGIIDWRFRHEPMQCDDDVHFALNCPTYEYADYAYKQCTELIDRYHPSVFWNDIGWPHLGERQLPYLLSHYYNTCPDGVVNDRFNDLHHDFTVKEYEYGAINREAKWENIRGLGLSFGYNAEEDERHIMSPQALVRELVLTVCNGGNLLINIGPKADGTIPEIQQRSLMGMGAWMKQNSEAIYDTVMSASGPVKTEKGQVNFTEKDGFRYLIVDAKASCEIALNDVCTDPQPLGRTEGLTWTLQDGILTLKCACAFDYPQVLRMKI